MRYRYLLDPVFLGAVGLYALNKFALKPYTDNAFVHGHVADCLCIPVWVPVMVAAMHAVGLRPGGGPPRAYEILIPLVVWSIAFEIVLPQSDAMRGLAIADPLDVLDYAGGALVATMLWRWLYRGGAGMDPDEVSTPGDRLNQ